MTDEMAQLEESTMRGLTTLAGQRTGHAWYDSFCDQSVISMSGMTKAALIARELDLPPIFDDQFVAIVKQWKELCNSVLEYAGKA